MVMTSAKKYSIQKQFKLCENMKKIIEVNKTNCKVTCFWMVV